jgi:hypothetical protein
LRWIYIFTFFLIVLFIFVFLSKYRSTYLLCCRDSPPAEASTQVLRCTCITNTIHQMRILTNFKVSSVVLRPKKLEIRKKAVKTVQEPTPPPILCHEIEPNPSKDNAMHEGDNPSFWDEFINLRDFIVSPLIVLISFH